MKIIVAAIIFLSTAAAQVKGPSVQQVDKMRAAAKVTLPGPITDIERLAVKTAEAASWQAQAIYWQAQAQAAAMAQKAQVAVAAHQQQIEALAQKCGEKRFDRETLTCEEGGTK